MYKFTLLLFLCAYSVYGQAQRVNLQELVNKKQFQEVIVYVDSLTSADSTDYATLSAIGQAYEGMLRYKDAYRRFSYGLQLDTTNIEAWNAVARTALSFGKVSEAKRCYHKVLEADSLNFYANHQLARLYYQLGDYGKSMERYLVLASIDGENPAILSGLADCQMKKGDAPNVLIAISLYGRVLSLNPENVRVASSLINTLLRMGDSKGALQVCDTALYYNPESNPIRQSRGMALYMNKDYANQESTEEYTEEIIKNDKELRRCLRIDKLKYSDICDFKEFSIVDNKRPKLCADRYDGLILTGYNWTKSIELSDILEFTDNLCLHMNEDNILELGFKDRDICNRVLKVSDEIDLICHSNEDNYMMELLADITRITISKNIIEYKDLYYLTEVELFDKIRNSDDDELLKLLDKFYNIKASEIPDTIMIDVKKRDLNPLCYEGRIKNIC